MLNSGVCDGEGSQGRGGGGDLTDVNEIENGGLNLLCHPIVPPTGFGVSMLPQGLFADIGQAMPPHGGQEPISNPPDHPGTEDQETNITGAAMILGGQFSLTRLHGQWKPALPSITEGSVMY
ncbi:hypothetical protein PR202_ga00020 [Eleusine coracana subsp. coracana]|uniref:Uncharacterized protein n=1 Tax=Eleusine coracana subsp. coracana TaxID=191504 RepID=A0AAV5BAL9_ELECO|nr:hypothetical protein PR202_ga00020 [Eleusine coracana subsp. coracana]